MLFNLSMIGWVKQLQVISCNLQPVIDQMESTKIVLYIMQNHDGLLGPVCLYWNAYELNTWGFIVKWDPTKDYYRGEVWMIWSEVWRIYGSNVDGNFTFLILGFELPGQLLGIHFPSSLNSLSIKWEVISWSFCIWTLDLHFFYHLWNEFLWIQCNQTD